MATALDIIERALRLLQVRNKDTTLDADEANCALVALNTWIDSLDNSEMMVYQSVSEAFNTVAGLNPHTIGPTGTFNTTRPTAIDAMYIHVNGIDYPINQIEYDIYSSIALKNLISTWPTYCWNDMSYPIANLYFYPLCNAIYPITILSRKPLQNFTLTDVVNLPKGYERMLAFNLAVEIAPEYQVTAGPDVMRIASTSYKMIQRTNYVELQQSLGARGMSYRAAFLGGL